MIRLYANAANTGALLQAVLGGAVATTQPKATVSYIDMNPATTAQVQAQRGTTYQVALNSTTDVTIASPPGAAPSGTTGQSGYVRMIDYVGIYNEDTASVTVTVKIDDAGTDRILYRAVIPSGGGLYYEDGRGWYVTDATGAPIINGAGITSGTWTVRLFDDATAGNVSPTTTTGNYTLFPDGLVQCSFGPLNNIDTTGMTGANVLRITLPIPSVESMSAGSIATDTLNFPAGTNYVVPCAQSSGRCILRAIGDNVADASIIVTDITSTTTDIVQFSLSYRTV